MKSKPSRLFDYDDLTLSYLLHECKIRLRIYLHDIDNIIIFLEFLGAPPPDYHSKQKMIKI